MAVTKHPSQGALDLYHRGVAYEQNLDSASAFELYHGSIAADPVNPSALDVLGRLLTERRYYRLARICFRRALKYVDEHYFYLHLAECERLDHRYRDASEALAGATRLWDSADWQVQRALIAYDQGDHFEALTACAAAFTNHQPAHARATWVSALAKLASGDFRDGFVDYEARMKVQLTHFRNIPMQMWQGQPLDGKTLWIIAEQGLGDAIMFARFVPEHGRIIIDVHKELTTLFMGMFPDAGVRVLGSPIPSANYFVPMGSLPFRTGHIDPACPPYIDEYKRELWSFRELELRVGICWAAGLHHERAHQKSMPFVHMLELLDVPGVHLVSLQVGAEMDRLAEEHADCLIKDAGPYLSDMADTVSAIADLDLVITVDTAVAHLAGAMGKPCWVMLPYVCDWRWRFPGNGKTIWYDSVRLFQQESPGDWPGVMKRVVSALAGEVSRRS